jgi:PilZ domain
VKNTRRFQRYTINLKAQYFLEEEKGEGKECTITTLGRGGVGIAIRPFEKIGVDSALFLELFYSEEFEPITVKGIVKWMKGEGSYFIIGMEVTSESDQDKLADLIKLLLV